MSLYQIEPSVFQGIDEGVQSPGIVLGDGDPGFLRPALIKPFEFIRPALVDPYSLFFGVYPEKRHSFGILRDHEFLEGSVRQLRPEGDVEGLENQSAGVRCVEMRQAPDARCGKRFYHTAII